MWLWILVCASMWVWLWLCTVWPPSSGAHLFFIGGSIDHLFFFSPAIMDKGVGGEKPGCLTSEWCAMPYNQTASRNRMQ